MPDYSLLEEKESPAADKVASEVDTVAADGDSAHIDGDESVTGTGAEAEAEAESNAAAAPSEAEPNGHTASATASALRASLSLDPPSTPSPAPHGSAFPFSPSSVVNLTPARRFGSPPPNGAAKGTHPSSRAETERAPLSHGVSSLSAGGDTTAADSALKANPEQSANPLSYICYSWLSSLVALGASRPLTDTDLYEVRTDYAARVASSRFQAEWAKEVKRATTAGNRNKASLLGPFNTIYGRNYWLAFLSKVTGDTLSFVQPMLLQLLLASLATQTFTYCMMAAFAMMVIGIQCRNCLMTAIYRKALRLSPKARQERSTGQIVNLMSTDCSKIDSALGWGLTLLACVVQVLIAVGLLVFTLGLSSLAGVAVIVVLIPVQGKIVKVLQSIRQEAVTWTDKRVKLSNEILQGMRVIKVYAFESAFLRRLTSIRLDEMALVRRGAYVRAGAVTIAQFGPIFMSLVAFIVLAATGGELSPENVFSALVLFNLLRFPLMQVPFVGGMLADALVSKRRIEEFLLSDEISDQPEQVRDSQYAVQIDEAEFTWETVLQDASSDEKEGKGKGKGEQKENKSAAQQEGDEEEKVGWLSRLFGRSKRARQRAWRGRVKEDRGGAEALLGNLEVDQSPQPTASTSVHVDNLGDQAVPATAPSALADVNLRVPHGSLTVIVGVVGSGKSSLLSGILGEMKRRSGRVSLCGSIGYCHQSAWIQNASLRDNILFGLPFDEQRYNEVIKVCELVHDLAILPDGDLTEIGEKGITLSGGQKQRVNLARAVYFDADILLLDDIFSALDMHVGAAIFKNCILGSIRHKTRLLVTHQLQYAQFADQVLFMHDGRITEQGTFEQLVNSGQDFAQLIANYGGGANEGEEEEEGMQQAEDERKESSRDSHHAALNEEKQQPLHRLGSMTRQLSRASSRRGSLKSEEGETDVQRMKKAHKARQRAAGAALMTVEERSTGGIGWPVYNYYFQAMGGNAVLAFLLVIVVVGTAAKMATDLWLAWWSEDQLDLPVHYYMLVYAALGVLQCLFVFLLSFFVARYSTRGAVQLHDRSFASVSRAPLSFFDTTPLGRILHRFSKDQDTIDSSLSESIRSVIMLAAQIVGSLVLMCVATPVFVVPLLPCMWLYWKIQSNFRQSSREVKRMDSTTRSPLFAHFSETLTGLSTIRAYHREDVFIRGNEARVDGNMRAYYLVVTMQRWIGLRLETLASAVVFFSGAVIVLTSFYYGLGVGLAGLSLSYAVSMTTSLVFLIRQSIEAEMAMNSVERSQYYSQHIEQERPALLPEDTRLTGGKHAAAPDSPWPSRGEVTFEHLSMRYRPNLPLILQDVSIRIKGGERIGIVGRTGAGKSSLMTALFRLVEPSSGHIAIDGVNINDIGLTTLRQSLAIIPQDAVLFSGSIRTNLDPFGAHSDAQLWSVLEKSHMKAAVSRLEAKLEAPVNEGGENFSQGERCQLCLARALLKDAKVLVMDEATASIDTMSDAFIQQSLRSEFSGTILTIAHRLITIVDYHKVLVLDAGRVVEFDTPAALLRIEGGAFRALVAETGETNAALLHRMAEQAETGTVSFSKEMLENAK